MVRVIICGSRNVGRPASDVEGHQVQAEVARSSDERAFVLETLSSLHAEFGFSAIIAGSEGGAERLGSSWAALNNVPLVAFVRERRGFRKETIDERNMRMLSSSRPDRIICFGAGESTERLIASAQKMGVPVKRVEIARLPQRRPPAGKAMTGARA
ncbi:MAG: hypothetical protein CTY15_08140 [Methylocystis sp.]|nr:MAG: hypothetical protein CTY15_08140 [Methylocystis sp.]